MNLLNTAEERGVGGNFSVLLISSGLLGVYQRCSLNVQCESEKKKRHNDLKLIMLTMIFFLNLRSILKELMFFVNKHLFKVQCLHYSFTCQIQIGLNLILLFKNSTSGMCISD